MQIFRWYFTLIISCCLCTIQVHLIAPDEESLQIAEALSFRLHEMDHPYDHFWAGDILKLSSSTLVREARCTFSESRADRQDGNRHFIRYEFSLIREAQSDLLEAIFTGRYYGKPNGIINVEDEKIVVRESLN